MTRWRSMLLWGAFLAWTFPAAQASAQGTAAGVFTFREPASRHYSLDKPAPGAARVATDNAWLAARPNHSTNIVFLGSRVVIQTVPGVQLATLLTNRPLAISRQISPQVWILQSPDATTAARQAHELSALPGVLACHPVMKRDRTLKSPYARLPDDTYYSDQWYLENRNATGESAGADLNVRAAWPVTRGAGVVVAIADSGVELDHPELNPRAVPELQWDFSSNTTNARPFGSSGEFWSHGTGVAGLAVARGNNSQGMTGVAPEAGLASWRIFADDGKIVSEERLMDMFQAFSNVVAVQNHSWGTDGLALEGPTLLEDIGISNAVTFGRNGKGVVMVRAAGNLRATSGNANDDGFVSDPRGIAVAAVNNLGRATSYSEPGACVLVAAPAQDANSSGLFTTDMLGSRGVNQINFLPPDASLSDYRFASLGLTGTSAAAPLVSGVAALILATNPALTYRDVQQILILCARHLDLTDPDLRTNGAGFRISHNVGFGIPDAGEAVRLAAIWPNRPPATLLRYTNTTTAPVSDAGTRLLVNADGLPGQLSIDAAPGTGPQPPIPFPTIPLLNAGTADDSITQDLTGKGALIQRGNSTFANKVNHAAEAGATFAVIYNSGAGNPAAPGGDALFPMAGLEYTSIPAVFIGQRDGESLVALLSTNSTTRATMGVQRTILFLNVTDNLLLEHVSLRVTSDHPRRGDLRIILTSPQGTSSVLQQYNQDGNPGPAGWEYHSVRHFYEASAGTWFVSISDAFPGQSGSIQELVLTLQGVAITDADHDGLDDNWELAHFGNLAQGPQDDPDGDGFSNAREQIMGTSPTAADIPFRMDLSPLKNDLVRLSWPGVTNRTYQVFSGTNPGQPLTLMTNVAGHFPETELVIGQSNLVQRIFRVQAVAP